MTTLQETHAFSAEQYRLARLHRWLSLESMTAVFGGAAFFLPPGLIMGSLALAALVFTPYMLRELHALGRSGWIWGFAIGVGVPFLIAKVVILGSVAGFLIGFVPLVTFYFYTWLLRHQVGEWLEEARWRDG